MSYNNAISIAMAYLMALFALSIGIPVCLFVNNLISTEIALALGVIIAVVGLLIPRLYSELRIKKDQERICREGYHG